jgi:methylthioribose-1-phosphate isomerase
MLPQTIQWVGDHHGFVRLIDQTRLPGEHAELAEDVFLDCRTPQDIWHAIQRLCVRGAPAIGIAAAYGVVLAAQVTADAHQQALQATDYLATSRPTAVNLFWALDRMRIAITRSADPFDTSSSSNALVKALLAEAIAIHDDDRQRCHRIGALGGPLLSNCSAVLTHCNAGALATSEYGTALAMIYSAHQRNPSLRVYADETRPLLQGARLTAWELSQSGIDVTVLCDSMAAQVMREKRIQAIVVGADRIAANGDTANKIGTYALAIIANYHAIPFYVAAPLSTFDFSIPDGSHIPIEQRAPEEIAVWQGRRVAPASAKIYNPAFDVTPSELITAIVTDVGVIHAPNPEKIASLVKQNPLSL